MISVTVGNLSVNLVFAQEKDGRTQGALASAGYHTSSDGSLLGLAPGPSTGVDVNKPEGIDPPEDVRRLPRSDFMSVISQSNLSTNPL